MIKGPHLSDFFSNRKEPGRAGLPVMSVTMNDSLVLRDDLERRTESALRPDQHLLVRRGDIAYNMMRMWQGACGLATADCIVSPAYVVLAPKAGIDSRFAYHWFKSSRMIHLFWAYSHGLTEDRLRLYFDEFAEIPASPPPLEQQRRVVAVLDAWDQAIEQTERLIDTKRRRLNAMFPPFERKGLKRPHLIIRRMSKRWGSYTPAGNITLNIDLMRASPNLIDYVICHELAHAFYGNHSEEWQHLLSSVMPDWEVRKCQLETTLR
jgi:hypothetical protein